MKKWICAILALWMILAVGVSRSNQDNRLFMGATGAGSDRLPVLGTGSRRGGGI